MKRNPRYTLALAKLAALSALTLGLLTGCASVRKAKEAVTVSPSPALLTPDSDGRAQMDVTFRVPAGYLSERSRLVILPGLMVGDSVKEEYSPVVIDAPIYNKKKERREVLVVDYSDPYAGHAVVVNRTSEGIDLPYSRTILLPEGADNARVVGVVSTDGCGECSAIDTIEIAAVRDLASLIDVKNSLSLVWMDKEFVVRPKTMEGSGVANLQFAINRQDIDLSLGNNRRELENMVSTLSPVLNDTLATLTSLDIYGMASADGSLSYNTALARRRAEAASLWLVKRLNIRPSQRRVISVGSRSEGWQPVLDAMTADGNPDSAAVKEILQKYADGNDDVQERYIRRLPCWNEICAKYLQNDRKVEYVYSYVVKSFTSDAELLDMYLKRPDAFNEEELLRVAALTAGDGQKKAVYATTLRYFPQSRVAANNLAVLCLREGNDEAAREALGAPDANAAKSREAFNVHPDETLNTLAASYVYAGDYDRAAALLQENGLPQARYNLGLVRTAQRRLQQAYELLRPFGDVNSAIAALNVDRTDEAKEMLDAIRDESPVTEYVRALTAARLDDRTALCEHLGRACADESLRVRAAGEADFYPYRNEEAFRALIH